MKLIDLMELSSYTECRFYTADGHNLEWNQFDEKYHLYDEAEWTFEELLEKKSLALSREISAVSR